MEELCLDLIGCNPIAKSMEAIIDLIGNKNIILKVFILSINDTNVSDDQVKELHKALKLSQTEMQILGISMKEVTTIT